MKISKKYSERGFYAFLAPLTIFNIQDTFRQPDRRGAIDHLDCQPDRNKKLIRQIFRIFRCISNDY